MNIPEKRTSPYFMVGFINDKYMISSDLQSNSNLNCFIILIFFEHHIVYVGIPSKVVANTPVTRSQGALGRPGSSMLPRAPIASWAASATCSASSATSSAPQWVAWARICLFFYILRVLNMNCAQVAPISNSALHGLCKHHIST